MTPFTGDNLSINEKWWTLNAHKNDSHANFQLEINAIARLLGNNHDIQRQTACDITSTKFDMLILCSSCDTFGKLCEWLDFYGSQAYIICSKCVNLLSMVSEFRSYHKCDYKSLY